MKSKITSCDTCIYYVYDEEYDYYTCSMNLDEDEMYNFIKNNVTSCSYYKPGDEYTIVRKQI